MMSTKAQMSDIIFGPRPAWWRLFAYRKWQVRARTELHRLFELRVNEEAHRRNEPATHYRLHQMDNNPRWWYVDFDNEQVTFIGDKAQATAEWFIAARMADDDRPNSVTLSFTENDAIRSEVAREDAFWARVGHSFGFRTDRSSSGE